MAKVERYERKEAICPFYKDEPYHQFAIRCEGSISIACTNVFESAKEKKKQLSRYCTRFNFFECPLASDLLKKYAAEDIREKEERHTELYKISQKKGV